MNLDIPNSLRTSFVLLKPANKNANPFFVFRLWNFSKNAMISPFLSFEKAPSIPKFCVSSKTNKVGF
ncbi:MAG: hypothetical protein OXC67_00140, partial [Flavobacteriaceae bacterium]|nr:hypothetical protein [Flavobacteriaceae bacterium]